MTTKNDRLLLEKGCHMQSNARLFLQGANSLSRHSNVVRCISDILYEDILLSGLISSIVLRALSLELALKAIHIFHHRKDFKRIHDLSKLFKGLGEAASDLTKRCQQKMKITPKSVEQLLFQHRDIFTLVRYLDTSQNIHLPQDDHWFLVVISEESVAMAHNMYMDAKINGKFLHQILEEERSPPPPKEEIAKNLFGSSIPFDL